MKFPKSVKIGTTIAYAALIFWFSSMPLPGPIKEIFAFDPTRFLLHFLAYLLLGSLIYSSRNKLIFAFALATSYGFLLELWQLLIPGRFFAFTDILANSSGSLAGAFLLKIFA